MRALKIGIVEDDFLIAASLLDSLKQLGYDPAPPARSYAEALDMIEKDSPDLLLIDITLKGDLDGIELAATVNKNHPIPFIFLTGNSDHKTVDRAKSVNPFAYLLKPASQGDLFSSIEIAISNSKQRNEMEQKRMNSSNYLKDYIFIKEGTLFFKIKVEDVLYVESDNVYINIYTSKKNFVVRSSMDDFIRNHANTSFFRVHRSFVINLKYLEMINETNVQIEGIEVPMQKTYRQELLDRINFLK